MPVLEINKEYVQKSNTANVGILRRINHANYSHNSTVTLDIEDGAPFDMSLISFQRNWRLA